MALLLWINFIAWFDCCAKRDTNFCYTNNDSSTDVHLTWKTNVRCLTYCECSMFGQQRKKMKFISDLMRSNFRILHDFVRDFRWTNWKSLVWCLMPVYVMNVITSKMEILSGLWASPLDLSLFFFVLFLFFKCKKAKTKKKKKRKVKQS